MKYSWFGIPSRTSRSSWPAKDYLKTNQNGNLVDPLERDSNGVDVVLNVEWNKIAFDCLQNYVYIT